VRGPRRTTQFHGVGIVQYAVYVRAGTPARLALLRGGILLHHFELGPGFTLDQTYGGIMIAVRVADQQNLRVFVFEAEAGDASLERRHILLEVRID
jgi:hypothetical protein